MSLAAQASSSATAAFVSLPPEILEQIFLSATTPSFFQLVQVNRKVFTLASQSRRVLLYHLGQVPGPKRGLDALTIPLPDLFLTFRQRATANLVGVNLRADCRNLRFAHGEILQPQASCIAPGRDGQSEISLVLKNSLCVHSYSYGGQVREGIESPFVDGRAKIVQVTHGASIISVLYAWTPSEVDPVASPTTQQPTVESTSDQTLQGECTNDGHFEEPVPGSNIRYHLLHYNVHTNDEPVIFYIPAHESHHRETLVPVHMAVHDRLQCAILWDLPNRISPSAHASVLLYTADQLPQTDPGTYQATVLYPFDHAGTLYPIPGGTIPHLSKEDNVVSSSLTPSTARGRLYHTLTLLGSGRRERDLRSIHVGSRPRAIAFFKRGRRLFLYAPGSVTPYATLLANDAIRRRQQQDSLSPSSPLAPLSPLSVRIALSVRCRWTNATTINGHRFSLGLPFFSRHKTLSSPGGPTPEEGHEDSMQAECLTDMLCLGTTTLPPSTTEDVSVAGTDFVGPTILTIVHISRRLPYWACRHTEKRDNLPDLPAPPTPYAFRTLIPDALDDLPGDMHNDDQRDEDERELRAENLYPRDTTGLELRVAARLWGWRPQRTTLTALDTVSISPRGDRIAVAQWDRVLVYALDPGPLCDDIPDDDKDDDDSSASDTTGDSNALDDADHPSLGLPDQAQTAQTLPSPRRPVTQNSLPNQGASAMVTPDPASATFPSAFESASFYPHVDDPVFGRLVELQPVVLKMDEGAVVRRIIWGEAKHASEDVEGWDKHGQEMNCGGRQQPETDLDQREEGSLSFTRDGRKAETDKTDEQDMATHIDAGAGRSETIKTSKDDDAKQAGIRWASGDLEPQTVQGGSPDVDMGNSYETTAHRTVLPPPHISTGTLPAQMPSSRMEVDGQVQAAASKSLDHDAPPTTTMIDHSVSTSAADTVSMGPNEDRDPDSIRPREGNPGLASPSERHQETNSDKSTVRNPSQLDCATPEEKNRLAESPWKPAIMMGRKRQKRPAENELMVLTDQGVQCWNLSMWGRGKRIRRDLDKGNVLQ